MRLDAWGVDEETAFTTELIVSELVGNAVRYGTPPLQLRLIFERMLTCEVSDTATSAPQVKHARTIDETGRGCSSSRASRTSGARVTGPGERPSGRSNRQGCPRSAEAVPGLLREPGRRGPPRGVPDRETSGAPLRKDRNMM